MKERDLKDVVKKYNDTPEENEKKLKEEEEKSSKLKEWALELKNIETNISLLYNTSCETLKPTKRRKFVMGEF